MTKEPDKYKSIDDRLARLNAQLLEQAARRKRNEPEAILSFLEQIVVPELRAINQRLESIEQMVGKDGKDGN